MKRLVVAAVRNISKNKLFTIINIIGFSFGISVVLLIALYIRFETSYEDFLEAKDIYRVSLTKFINNDQALASAENFPGVGPALKNELNEVLSYARLYNMGYKNNTGIGMICTPTFNFLRVLILLPLRKHFRRLLISIIQGQQRQIKVLELNYSQ